MERDKWTGRYILPDGRAVAPEEVRVPDGRFFEYGTESIQVLLWWGVIREEREALFIVVDDRKLRFWLNPMPMVLDSRRIVINTVS